jgi:hypothetical protein
MEDQDIKYEDYKMDKLNDIHKYLWLAGRLNHINPLHMQICMNREIKIVEDPYLHLLWYDNVIYIKPFENSLINKELTSINNNNINDNKMIKCINGFLLSYMSLIKTKSDYYIALEKNLLEKDITWQQWKEIREKNLVIKKYENIEINERYIYGELRLYRLNIIYRLTFRGLCYFNIFRQYDVYFNKYFQVSVILFAYLSIYLTAMQVMLASTNNNYYNFSIFCIFIATIVIFLTFIIFIIIFTYNLINTLKQNFKNN